MSGDRLPPIPAELSELHDLLSAPRRWHVIRVLEASDEEPLEVSVLAKRITAIEQDTAPRDATGDPYRNVYNALCQSHLPKLDRFQVIEFDPDRKRVSTGPRFAEAWVLLTVASVTYAQLTD